MVLVHFKKDEQHQFLYETPASTLIDELTKKVVELHNARLRLLRLVDGVSELGQYGVARPIGEQGLEYPKEKPFDHNGPWLPDPMGRRDGRAPEEKLAAVIEKTVAEAKQCIDKSLLEHRLPLQPAALEEAFAKLKGATMMAFPQGLPEHDPVRCALEDAEDIGSTPHAKLVHDPASAQLWWANKKLAREGGKKVSDYVGKNEKTKILVKVTSMNAGAPVREAPVSEQQQKEMMAFYYKKQEEEKRMTSDGQDSYLRSDWANPNGLKNAFQGVGNVKFR